MARTGFIQDKLDIKMLILYILSHLAAPVGFDVLTDLVQCDNGVDYFVYAESLAELQESGHVLKTSDYYIATELGRRRNADLESSLSPVVRKRCDQRLIPLNAALKRKAQVRSQIFELPDGGVTVKLVLDDDLGTLFSLSLMAATREDGEKITKRFTDHPDQVYNGILGVLLSESKE